MDAEQIHEKLEERIRKRRLALGPRLGTPISRISPETIAEISVGEEIGRGGFAIVHGVMARNGVIPGADGLRLAMKRYPLASDTLQQGLAARVNSREATLDLLARAITAGDDTRVKEIGNALVLPLAYGYDPANGDLLVFFERYNSNLRGHLTELASLPPRERGERILDLFIAAGSGLAALHRAGYKHRDVKPDNLLVGQDGDERARWADFDIIGLQPEMRSEALTTMLDSQGVMLGTLAYLSPPLVLGDVTMKAAPDRMQDNWAFGVMLGEAIIPESSINARERMLTESIIQARHDLRRRSDLEERAAELGLPGIERVIVRATDTDHGYDRMDELVADLRGIGRGGSSDVVRNRRNKVAWEYRTGKENGDRYVARRKRLRTAAVGAALCGLIAAGSIGNEALQERAHQQRYAQSSEANARAATDLDPARLRAFIGAREREFSSEMERFHLPTLESRTGQVFPEGIFPEAGLTAYVTGRDRSSGFWLELLMTWWRATGDERYLKWHGRYAAEMQLELESKFSDRDWPTVGRYDTILRSMGEIERIPQSLRNIALPAKIREDALTAGAIGINQHSRKQSNPKMDLSDELWLIPLLIEAASSREVDRIIEIAKGEDATAGIASKEDLYGLLGRSGVRVCDGLVAKDGKSFWRAQRDEQGQWQRQSMDDTIPGFRGTQDEQAVLAESHVGLMRSIRQRIALLERTDIPLTPERDRDLTALRGCASRLEGYLESSRAGAPLLPEYLFLPQQDRKVRDLPVEMHANALWLRYLSDSGQERERDALMTRILGNVAIGDPPRREPTDERQQMFGMFPQTRAYYTDRVGPIYETEALFLQDLLRKASSEKGNGKSG